MSIQHFIMLDVSFLSNTYLYPLNKKYLSLILNIETSTKNCSVSLAENGKVLALKEINDGNYSHNENLHTFIIEALKDANKNINQIDAIAVSKGPGSYTGLRIGRFISQRIMFFT